MKVIRNDTIMFDFNTVVPNPESGLLPDSERLQRSKQ
jgi:hypothetical protein